MIQYSAQQIFANVVWDSKPDAKTQLRIFEIIDRNLEEINEMMSQALKNGEQNFQFDETKFLQ